MIKIYILIISLLFFSCSQGKNSGNSGKLVRADSDEITCPASYALVPSNEDLEVEAFCVMKYEARSNGESKPNSLRTGSPWYLSALDAKAACKSIGDNYDLISNMEWMSIARNIESQSSNWSGGQVGDGCIYRGAGDESNPCLEAYSAASYGENTHPFAKHTLSNNEEVWHIGSGVFEIVDWTLGGNFDVGPDCSSTTGNLRAGISCGAELSDKDYMPANPGNVSPYDLQDKALGQLIKGSEIAQPVALRGDSNIIGSFGPFSLITNQDIYNTPPWNISRTGNVGFRCVYRP